MSESSEEVYVTIVDPHDDIEGPLEVRLLVYFEVEPDEYEGPYLFYRGGIVVNHVEIYETFNFMGRLFEVGEEFPQELDRFLLHKLPVTIEEYVFEQLVESVNIPSRRYSDSRLR